MLYSGGFVFRKSSKVCSRFFPPDDIQNDFPLRGNISIL